MRSSIEPQASDTRATCSRACVAGLGALLLGGLAGLLADAARLEVGLALDVGGALLGGLDDQAHLLGRGARRASRRAGATTRLSCLHLVGEHGQVRVDGVGVVAPSPDGEVTLLDGLTVKGHAWISRKFPMVVRQDIRVCPSESKMTGALRITG